MRLKINNQDVQVSIFHMDCDEFKDKHSELVPGSPLANNVCPKKITVAEVIYDNCSSKSASYCHTNDQFNRRRGSTSALERAMKQHPSLRFNKELRKEVFTKMFRSEPSPYTQLAKLVRGRPELAKRLVELGKDLTTTD